MEYEFSRTELLIGPAAMEKLARSTVAIFGIGGVGSYTVEGLARSGVGKLVLIDGDFISITNLNRQIHATHKTISRPKVEVMRERILEINPRAEVITHQIYYGSESTAALVDPDYNYVVDTIDTVTAKIDLIINAQQKDIPIISSMGTGNKLDPTQFKIADIYATSVCPLARVMRRELRKRGIERLKVVYSPEVPIKPAEDEKSGDLINGISLAGTSCNSDPRPPIPGSIAFVPAVAGLIIAGKVIKDLIDYSPNG